MSNVLRDVRVRPVIWRGAPVVGSWATVVIEPVVDLSRPGLYEWIIEGVGSYIGVFTSPSRPFGEYSKNVTNLLNGKPYRKNKPESFRDIHYDLAEAFLLQKNITLRLLETISDRASRHSKEQELIRNRGFLNGTNGQSKRWIYADFVSRSERMSEGLSMIKSHWTTRVPLVDPRSVDQRHLYATMSCREPGRTGRYGTLDPLGTRQPALCLNAI
jgi:hypothetical protein